MRTMFGFLALASILLAGCWNEKRMEVNAIINPNVSEVESYTIISENAAVGEDDPHFERVVAMVEGYGLYRTQHAEEADVLVSLAYGVGEPDEEIIYVRVRRRGRIVWRPVKGVKYPK